MEMPTEEQAEEKAVPRAGTRACFSSQFKPGWGPAAEANSQTDQGWFSPSPNGQEHQEES